jgi:hypothetical protein
MHTIDYASHVQLTEANAPSAKCPKQSGALLTLAGTRVVVTMTTMTMLAVWMHPLQRQQRDHRRQQQPQ